MILFFCCFAIKLTSIGNTNVTKRVPNVTKRVPNVTKLVPNSTKHVLNVTKTSIIYFGRLPTLPICLSLRIFAARLFARFRPIALSKLKVGRICDLAVLALKSRSSTSFERPWAKTI